jgi:transketolase
MRKMCLECIYQLAKKDKRIIFIGSDLGVGTLDNFKRDFPDRFLMEGVSEQALIGLAAGMAKEGNIVYFNTIASFITRRCFEQDVLDLGLHNLPVRLIGSGGGLVYAPLGPTHLATDDIAIMRTIPNMTVLVPADAEEMKRLMPETLNYPGPIYIRLAKGGDPIVTPPNERFIIGKVVPIQQGSDVLLITTGITLQIAIDAASALKKQQIHIAIIHVPTVKPLDSREIIRYVKKIPVIITIEEHSCIGGLGSAVAQLIAQANFGEMKRFRCIGLPDVFMKEYGSQASIMEKYGITASAVIKEVRQLLL